MNKPRDYHNWDQEVQRQYNRLEREKEDLEYEAKCNIEDLENAITELKAELLRKDEEITELKDFGKQKFKNKM